MDDLREKVTRGLELCGYQEGMLQCDSCPYDGKDCWKRLKRDALSLLKAQEPIEPIKHLSTGQICGSCKKVLLRKYKYCPACGKAVKWDG